MVELKFVYIRLYKSQKSKQLVRNAITVGLNTYTVCYRDFTMPVVCLSVQYALLCMCMYRVIS